MLTVLLVVQIIIAIAMVSVILLQRNASDGLSGLSGAGNASGDSLISGRASANLLTRTTTILAIAFMGNSLAMATIVSRNSSLSGNSILSIESEETAPAPSVPIAVDQEITPALEQNTDVTPQEQAPDEATSNQVAPPVVTIEQNQEIEAPAVTPTQ